jgi:hypothetical protein
MDKKTRLTQAFDLELPDRPPILGGWLAAPEHIQTLTGCSKDDYWSDPFHWGLEAERVLGTDGVVTIHEPIARGEYRIVDGRVLEERAACTVEALLTKIEALLTPDEIEAGFDPEAAYAEYVAELQSRQAQYGDVVWCPADWSIIPKALWYHEYGYETSLAALALYPDRYRKLIQVSATRGRHRAILRARAICEGISPRALLTGEDLCSQQGPMASPDYLRREYFLLLANTLEPLRECGMDLEWIVDLRTRDSDPLLIFGPLAVTTTLPHGTPEDVRAEVRRAMDVCRDRASLVFFTSNTINPDVPLENIQTYWRTVVESRW